MTEYFILESLLSEFMEKILNMDIEDIIIQDRNFYQYAISDIAKALNIGKISLLYECSNINSNLLLHKEPLYTNGANILYDDLKPCDEFQKVSFSYSQNDGDYTLIFERIVNTQPWDDSTIQRLKIVSSLSFNIISRIKLIEISQASEYYDYSTGILNNNGIVTSLEKLSEENSIEDYFCVHINIRHFKTFNIQYSYAGGDEILKKFADNMYQRLGENQPFGHLGEDNFVAIIKKSNREDFLNYTKDISFQYNSDLIHIKLYIGIYDICKNDSISTILNNSATAFNIARETPNCQYIIFTEEMHKQAIEVKQIEDVMHTALRNGEFITYYQPKICINNFQLVGAEALVRWKKGDTLVAPYKFVPVFEKNGFITEIDFCMLRNVCSNIQKWIDLGIEPVTVSVNFSKLHLSNPNFVYQIKNTIKYYNISPKYIEIEFTETLDVENYNNLVQVNRELKKYGIKTSIDDFGAGFSSINMLKDVPVDVVKLDKSLIDDTASSTREKIIIQDIVKLAKTLDIEVIAEGVEDLEQLLFLKNINCNQIQGYIFDKPLCLEDFEQRLKNANYYKDNPKFKDFIYDNSISDGISRMNFGKYTIDLNTYKILDFNSSFCDIVGYSKEEILSNNFSIENFIVSDEVDEYIQNVINALKTHGEICEEYKMMKKNGTKIYVMCLGMLKCKDVGEFMISDISINKVIERENSVLKSHFDFAQHDLKSKNYMFEQIVKNLSGGIGLFSLQNDNTIKTIFISSSFYNVFNCKRSNFDKYKNNILEIVAPNSKEILLKDIYNCVTTNTVLIKRYSFKDISKKGDNTKDLTLKIKPLETMYDNYPMVHIVVADYNIDDIESEFINEIAKVSLLTEYTNLDMIPIQLKERISPLL